MAYGKSQLNGKKSMKQNSHVTTQKATQSNRETRIIGHFCHLLTCPWLSEFDCITTTTFRWPRFVLSVSPSPPSPPPPPPLSTERGGGSMCQYIPRRWREATQFATAAFAQKSRDSDFQKKVSDKKKLSYFYGGKAHSTKKFIIKMRSAVT